MKVYIAFKQVIILNMHYRQLNIWKGKTAPRIQQQTFKFI
jgi:hypothetical protein